ncbi:hypothetical protein B0H21DRAFT_829688 [Amylocystis lapponica]|nr:hypothetical protein B0H21DRAFT_829688 [Amylocystis lapponica]
MSLSTEALLEERVMQLQAISQRRNGLLREMYHMLRRREQLGNVPTTDDEEEGVQLFLEKFDLEKHPDTGQISNLLEDEWPEVAQDAAWPVVEPRVSPDSPMSEPPASPSAEIDLHGLQDLQYPDSNIPEPTSMDVDDESIVAIAAQRRPTPQEEEEPESDDVLILKSASPTPPQTGVRQKTKAFMKRRSYISDDDDHDELYLIGSPSPRSLPSSRPSVALRSRTRSATREASRAISEAPQRFLSPLLEQRQEESAEPESITTKEELVDNDPLVSDRMEYSISQQYSEDSVADLLDPSTLASPSEPRRPPQYFTSVPSSTAATPLKFSIELEQAEGRKLEPVPDLYHFDPGYTLPPLSILPAEFNRKKPTKQQRKREKEKEKGEKLGEKGDSRKDEFVSMGINKWRAVLRANPVWKKLPKATKCLSTRDWDVGMSELRFIRTVDRIEALQEAGKWSFRQPKKQRGVGGLAKTHHDYLLDEMKWMRIDFREESRWKVALAYSLAHAAIEWHEAGSLRERIRRGICVLWRRPRPEDSGAFDEGIGDDDMDVEIPGTEEDRAVDSRGTTTPANDDNSEDDSEEEHEQDKDVINVLEPSVILEEEIRHQEAESRAVEQGRETQGAEQVQPKMEDVDDLSALRRGQDAMDVDSQDAMKNASNSTHNLAAPTKPEDISADSVQGLKENAHDPLLGKHVLGGESTARSAPKHKSRTNVYAPLREQITYAEIDKLFLDFDDLDLTKGMSQLSAEDHALSVPPPPTDLSEIFPDLQPLTLLDVVTPSTSSGVTESRKKSDKRADKEKDDPNLRAEDTTYTKLVPLNRFMHSKPTLLGALQPAKHWKDGHWDHLEEIPVVAEFVSPSSRTIDDNMCTLFEGSKSNSPSVGSSLLPAPPKEGRKRVEHTWTVSDDLLLKHLAERYPNNWSLIADAYNSSKVTIVTDKRSPWDCFERWNVRWADRGRSGAPDATSAATEEVSQPPTPVVTSSMTTRNKRSASTSVALSAAANSNGGAAANAEVRKRKRHSLMHDVIRKSLKKREAALKTPNSASRKSSSVVHDTHGQYNKMPRLTPQELGRMKAEKEARENQELTLRRRGEAELARQQQLLQTQQQRLQPQGQPQQGQPQQQQPQQPQQQQQQQQGPNGVIRTPGGSLPSGQVVPQIRSQVGISQQQQRISNPMALANARLSPSQMLQVHAQAAQVRAQAQAQVQAQAQALALAQAQTHGQAQAQQSAAPSVLSAAAPALSAAHLSPPYAARATSSSPAIPQQSPPPQVGTPTSATSLSRPPSAQQSHAGIATPSQVPMNALARSAGHYYMPAMHGGQYTAEQIEHAIRLHNSMRVRVLYTSCSNTES